MDMKKMEEELAQTLAEGEMEAQNAEEKARKRLPIQTEIRIQAHIDPVVEETKRFRKMAEEVDERYTRYDRLVKESKD
jgi:23S rRNA A2030 N6-methylase RlmJ